MNDAVNLFSGSLITFQLFFSTCTREGKTLKEYLNAITHLVRLFIFNFKSRETSEGSVWKGFVLTYPII